MTAGPIRARVFYGGVALLYGAVFVPMGMFRLVDGDEGAYLLAARLVMEGKLLYHDFFYAQTPVIPYLYGSWIAERQGTRVAARICPLWPRHHRAARPAAENPLPMTPGRRRARGTRLA